jgi:hypothetical protein
LGYAARDSGHSRVPEPPDRTTGWIVMGILSTNRPGAP